MRREDSLVLAIKARVAPAFEKVLWAALCANFLYFGLDWIAGEADVHSAGAGSSFDVAVHVLALLVLAVLMEKFFPINSVSPDDWVYKVRPSSCIRLDLGGALIQVVGCAALGSMVGAANGHVVLYAFVAALARGIPPLVRRRTIPGLLSAGRAKLVTRASGLILDTELVHSALTDSQMRWIRLPPTSSYFRLTFRRILRQPHLLFLGSEIVLLSWSMANALPVHSVVFFMITWAMLGGAVARCADFTQLGGGDSPRYFLLLIHSFIAAGLILLMAPVFDVALAIVLSVPVIAWSGLVRSREHAVQQLTFLENEIAGFSPELVSFYLTGLFPPFLASLLLTTFAM